MVKSRSTGLILLGMLAIAVGILALAWPGVTILGAFGGGETAGTRAMFIVAGLVWVAFRSREPQRDVSTSEVS